MLSIERHERILDRVRLTGRVEVKELAGDFSVTTETVRRDLSRLEQRGLLRRVHGGAVPLERLLLEPARDERAAALLEEKRRIAAAAADEVGEADVLLLDAGTTTAEMVPALPNDRERTVVTNDLPLALRLAARPSFAVIVTGGRIRPATQSAVDAWAVDHLANIGVDIAFLATSGLSLRRGLTVSSMEEARTKRAMIDAARRVVLLADHSKLGQEYFATFAQLDEVDLLITDAGADERAVDGLRARGLDVRCV
jgi:DeoR family fructose operon transcriptional repressor